MNGKNLGDNYPKLISHMETSGYSKKYVDRFKREIKKILSAVDSKEWSCYSDVYLEYTKTSQSPDYLREKRTLIGALSSLTSMADIRMEDADMSFSQEVLIRCCHQNLNPSLTITVKQKRNVVRKFQPFIQNLIMHRPFSFHSSKKE